MSPLIDVQRRMVEAGRIRAGDRSSSGAPKKLDKWRLTSKDEQRLVKAADLWGGVSREWDGHPGEYELYTDTNALPILLLPGQLPVSWYELWSKGGCQRRCDGVHEMMSDSPCLCDGDDRECKPHTRLSVLLPDLPGIGSWMLSSTGWNAAAELAGAADLLQRASAQGVLIPARLRLEQRTSIKAGQTRKFAVPVIDIDVSFTSLLGAQGAGERHYLDQTGPRGYIPLNPGSAGPSLTEGLEQTAGQEVKRRPQGQTPIPPQHQDIEFGAPLAVQVEEPPLSEQKLITDAQRRRLFAIAKKAGVDKDALKEFIKTYTGQDSTAGIPVDAYEPLCAAIESQEVSA